MLVFFYMDTRNNERFFMNCLSITPVWTHTNMSCSVQAMNMSDCSVTQG